MKAKLLSNLQVIAEDGLTYNIYSGGTPSEFLFLDGAGLAPVRRILQGSPLQHGATDKGYRLEPRKMILHLYISAASETALNASLDQVAHIFSPSSAPLKLKATRLDGEIRQIDCYTDGTLDFAQSQQVGSGIPIVVPLLAPDPSWYNPSQNVQTVFYTAGSAVVNASATGLTWEDWPLITLTGPVTNPVLLHQQSGQAVTFTAAIPAGETFGLDFRPGYKRIYRISDLANRMNYVSAASIGAMNTIRVYSAKQLKQFGNYTTNSFQVSGTGTTGSSTMTVYWYKRYIAL